MGQVLQLWENMTGAVLPYAGASAPSGFLFCRGQVVNRAEYPNLFVVIGTTYNTGGETAAQFRLPDLRGEFVRGLDAGRGVDAGRTLGSAQAQAIQSHDHQMTADYFPTSQVFQSGVYAGVYQLPGVPLRSAAAGGPETRPRNVAMNFIIKT